MDRAGKFLTEWVRLDMDERWLKANVRLAEEQARLIQGVFATVFADPDLGLSESQRQIGTRVAARHLAAVTDVA